MKQYPIILIDSHYWKPLLNWIDTHIIAGGFADKNDKKLITIVDDVADAVEIIQRYHGQRSK
jgi:predicted Rossmann-fold nucleotide-binding protein